MLTRSRTDRIVASGTINLDALRKLPQYVLPATRTLQADSGNGCAGDPPGYPTYFTRSVYTKLGDEPTTGPTQVITCDGVHYVTAHVDDYRGDKTWEQTEARRDALMRRLWQPLPADHPRVVAWIESLFAHHRHHYLHPTEVEHGRPKSYFWTGTAPSGGAYYKPHEKPKTAPHATEAWHAAEAERIALVNAAIDAENTQTAAQYRAIAIPENHAAVHYVRRYYPELSVEALTPYITTVPRSPGNWWETLPECPSPDACPGQYSKAHPVNGNWCQFCGWRAADAAA